MGLLHASDRARLNAAMTTHACAQRARRRGRGIEQGRIRDLAGIRHAAISASSATEPFRTCR
jgi:hypothetical protein